MSLFMKGNDGSIDAKRKRRALAAAAEAHQNMMSALRHETPDRVPVVLWYSRGVIGIAGGSENMMTYYEDPEIKLATQLLPLEVFPGILIVPGIFFDLGLVVETSGFGCKVRWFDYQPPTAAPCLTDLSGVSKLKLPNPFKDGLFPMALEHYRYMLDRLDPKFLEACPLYAGSIGTLGPMEIAAAMLGQTELYMSFYDNPEGLHELLNFATEGLLLWMKALESINGGHRMISLVEHIPSMISDAHAEAFFVPYFRRIREAYPEAILIFHNEGPSDHYLERIPEAGADVFFCGDVDLSRAKRIIGDRVTLMGNINPLGALLNGSKDEVIEEGLACLESAAAGGGFFLSNGGGLAAPPGSTPLENITAMLEATKIWAARRK
jgi:uroporphyrinogen-III decarboxylase